MIHPMEHFTSTESTSSGRRRLRTLVQGVKCCVRTAAHLAMDARSPPLRLFERRRLRVRLTLGRLPTCTFQVLVHGLIMGKAFGIGARLFGLNRRSCHGRKQVVVSASNYRRPRGCRLDARTRSDGWLTRRMTMTLHGEPEIRIEPSSAAAMRAFEYGFFCADFTARVNAPAGEKILGNETSTSPSD